MPKLKTHKGAAARFRITGTGKVLRMKGRRGHFRRRRAKNVKRMFTRKQEVSAGDSARIKRLLPNGLP